jgi:hypothetical protein
MAKLYQVQIAGRHRMNYPTPYFSTEVMAVEQALVYLISTSENCRNLCLETKTVKSWFHAGSYYYFAEMLDESEHVSLNTATISLPTAGYCSLEQQPPQWDMLRTASENLLNEEEEGNSWINNTVAAYNEAYLKTIDDNISDVIECWNQRIKKLNEILNTIFDKDDNLPFKLETYQKKLDFTSGRIKFSQNYPEVHVLRSNITIDEVIGVD